MGGEYHAPAVTRRRNLAGAASQTPHATRRPGGRDFATTPCHGSSKSCVGANTTAWLPASNSRAIAVTPTPGVPVPVVVNAATSVRLARSSPVTGQARGRGERLTCPAVDRAA